MTHSRIDPERYARVKRLFHEAVRLPAEKRPAFLAEQCRDASELRADLETLLRHHDSETILTRAPVDGSATVAPVVRPKAESRDLPTDLSPQFVAELLGLLRGRLVGLSTVLLAAMFYGLLWNVIRPSSPFYWHGLVALFLVLTCCALLNSPLTLTLRWLRITEAVMMISVCVVCAVVEVLEVQRGALAKDPASIVGASMWSYMTWCVVILILRRICAQSLASSGLGPCCRSRACRICFDSGCVGRIRLSTKPCLRCDSNGRCPCRSSPPVRRFTRHTFSTAAAWQPTEPGSSRNIG